MPGIRVWKETQTRREQTRRKPLLLFLWFCLLFLLRTAQRHVTAPSRQRAG